MHTITLYETSPKCKDGVCTLGEDAERIRIDEMVDSFLDAGYKIERYTLSESPLAFAENREVGTLVVKNGDTILPITVVDTVIAKTSTYPTAEEFAAWLSNESV